MTTDHAAWAPPLVCEIVEALSAAPGLVTRVHVPSTVATHPVRAVSADRDAEPGTASWMSTKVWQQTPERLAGYRGTLLVAPAGVPLDDMACAVVTCDSPKRGFALLLATFFPHLAGVRWPTDGSRVSDESTVDPSASLAPGAVIGSGCTIGPRVQIGPNTVLANTCVEADVVIGANCTIGLSGFGYERDHTGRHVRFPHVGLVRIGTGVEIGSNTCIDRGTLGATIIGPNVKIDNLVHVAHNVTIGENCLVIAHAMLGGSVTLGADTWCAPSVAVLNKLTIGANATLGLGAAVLRDVAPGETVFGNPGRTLKRDA